MKIGWSPSALWHDAWGLLMRDAAARRSLWLLGVVVLAVLVGPWFSPYSYETQDLQQGASAPSLAHWFGTDILGRDLLTRLLYGGRISLAVSLSATAVALLLGVSWGTLSAYLGGRVDAVMMRIVDILYALPFMVVIILLTVSFGRSMLLLFLAIGCLEWLSMARIVRAQVLSLREREFIQAAECIGLQRWMVMLRHVLPNALGPITVYATLTVPNVMLLEAFLSFLGLGVQAPHSSWGVLISHGVQYMEIHPWLLFFPGITLTLVLFALNVLGDSLRDALDPAHGKL